MTHKEAQKFTDLTHFFNQIFLAKKAKNPKYSMRAFARDLSLTQGRLWELIHGRYVPGTKVTERISEVLRLSEEDKAQLNQLVSLAKDTPTPTLRELKTDEFALISDWEHFAIINLLGTKDSKSCVEWIAKRLSISVLQAEGAVQRLLDAGLLVQTDKGLTPSFANVSTENEIPSPVLRESQRQVIVQSLDSLQRDSVDVRSITSVTFPANIKNLPKAKKLISEFSARMAELMEKGDRTEVYNLAVQLVPVTASASAN
ncbi:MAG: DUF4423 domain-containing protein [Bdellovibrio sp.]|nr:DUF4423 domain-containing protein [Bdellovibrio sp.]